MIDPIRGQSQGGEGYCFEQRISPIQFLRDQRNPKWLPKFGEVVAIDGTIAVEIENRPGNAEVGAEGGEVVESECALTRRP